MTSQLAASLCYRPCTRCGIEGEFPGDSIIMIAINLACCTGCTKFHVYTGSERKDVRYDRSQKNSTTASECTGGAAVRCNSSR